MPCHSLQGLCSSFAQISKVACLCTEHHCRHHALWLTCLTQFYCLQHGPLTVELLPSDDTELVVPVYLLRLPPAGVPAAMSCECVLSNSLPALCDAAT